MKTLPPQILARKDYMPMATVIFSAFQEILFKPLLDMAAGYNAQLKKKFDETQVELRNEEGTPLMYALRTGMVQYKSGVFSGSFSRDISANLRRLGAHFDKRSGTYRIPASQVPAGIKAEASAYEINAREIHESIGRKLNEIQANLEPIFEKFELNADPTVDTVAAKFDEIAKQISVMPQLTEASKKIFAEEYSENMKLYIKKFTEEAIHSLRESVEKNAIAGYRFDRLAATIQDQYKVSATKAEFLARQETSLFMSEFRKVRFSEAGVTRYIWRTSRDQRVRDGHAHLEGKTFFYSQPPIVDKATGRTGNPGTDYGCRCVDEPVLEPIAVGT